MNYEGSQYDYDEGPWYDEYPVQTDYSLGYDDGVKDANARSNGKTMEDFSRGWDAGVEAAKAANKTNITFVIVYEDRKFHAGSDLKTFVLFRKLVKEGLDVTLVPGCGGTCFVNPVKPDEHINAYQDNDDLPF